MRNYQYFNSVFYTFFLFIIADFSIHEAALKTELVKYQTRLVPSPDLVCKCLHTRDSLDQKI